jgi:survival-of-motor-neuron-related-splicing factor 30
VNGVWSSGCLVAWPLVVWFDGSLVGLRAGENKGSGSGAMPRPVPASPGVTFDATFSTPHGHLDTSPALTATATPLRNLNMADHIKQTKNAINAKKQEIAQEEAQRAEWADQLAQMDALLKDTGGSDDMKAMRAEMLDSIAAHDAKLNRLRPELAALEAQLPQAPSPAPTEAAGLKFDPEKHPVLRKAMEKQEPEKAVTFSIGDICEAQWTDRSWYKAKIQSILGSVSAPKYLVRFIEYDDTLTVDRSAVRPLPSKRKREPDAASTPTPSAPVTSPHVISGPATTNPNALAAKNAGSAEDMANKKPSRVPTKGTLKKRASAWADFQNKVSKKGVAKKESMFRTSTEAGSRGRHFHCPLPEYLLTTNSRLHGLWQGHDRDSQAPTLRPQGRC